MNILVLGGSGFIGRRVVAILNGRGHRVTTPARSTINLSDLDETAARAALVGQDVVVNCVGIMSRNAALLETVHHAAPKRLAEWAREAGVRHWVNLSALGADAAHDVAFVGSKGRGDQALLTSGLHTVIARPSVVYGRGGASCELFIKLARLPLLALPNGGCFDWQPVHVSDVAVGLALLAEHPPAHGTVIDMVGSRQLTFAEYLNIIRATVHRKPPQKVLPVSLNLLRPLMPLTNVLSNGFLSAGSLKLLQQGSCADVAEFARLLGRQPLSAEVFYAHED